MVGENFNVDENPAQEVSSFQSLTELSDQFNSDEVRRLQQQFSAENVTDQNGLIETEPGTYRINGTLSENDIEKLNNFKDDTIIILDNTVGLSSELLSKIETDRVFFSIKGALDYDNIKKFDTGEYKRRTEMSPKGLESVIKYFERVENEMNPEWTDLQKCMYAYNALVTDMEYSHDEHGVDRKYESRVPGDVITRSLNGVNYGELVCAGFALTFKEMMDRVGIDCSYQNVPYTHDFNIVSIDGKNYGIDVTWDNNGRQKSGDSECSFANFGQESGNEFYYKYGHGIAEKDRVELSTIPPEELDENLSIITPQIATREKGPEKSFQSLNDTERGEYLPIKKEELEADTECGNYVKLLFELTSEGVFDDKNSELAQILQQRKGFVLDMVGINFRYSKTETGKSEFERLSYLLDPKRSGIEIDQLELDNLIGSLNNKLNEAMSGYVNNLYESANEILENFSNTNESNVIIRANQYTKLITIRNAREYLTRNGYDTQDVDNICEKIDNALGLNNSELRNPEDVRKNEIDFFGAALEGDLIDAMQRVNNGEISKEDLVNNFGNAEAWVSRLMKNDLSEYSLSKEDIKDIINNILDKYRIV